MNPSAIETSSVKSPKNVQAYEGSKTELLEGRRVAKPSANRWHNLISTNFAIAIGSRIQRNQVEVYTSDMLVQLSKHSACFPDVVLVHGQPSFADQSMEILTNPTVVIEIFSANAPSTDRQQKLEGFLSVPTIKECLLVSETEMRVEHYARQNAKQWIYRIYNERDDVITLESVNCKMSLAEVYAQVKLREGELSSKAVN